jgi:hypothetical protein
MPRERASFARIRNAKHREEPSRLLFKQTYAKTNQIIAAFPRPFVL